MKRKAILSMVTAVCLSSSITAFAAPETMPDGAVFDAEYYAQNNPDVVAELGTGRDAMYQHFTIFGKNEGRLPFAPGTQIPTASQMEKPSEDNEEPPIEGVLGTYGADYTVNSWGTFESYAGVPGTDGMKKMTVRSEIDNDMLEFDMQELAPYTVAGYEWRPIHAVIGGEFNEIGRWWPEYNYRFWAEDSDNWEQVGIPEDIYMYRFQITQDGKDYTECRFASMGGAQVGEVHTLRRAYFLVPKNYTGKLGFIVRGMKSTAEGLVVDEENAVTYIF